MTVKEYLVKEVGADKAKKLMQRFCITETEKIGFRLSQEFSENMVKGRELKK